APVEPPKTVAADPERKMRLFLNRAALHKPFTVTLYAKGAMAGEVVWLELPHGVRLMPGDVDWRVIPPPTLGNYSSVVWRVQASQEGRFAFTAHAAGMLTETRETFTSSGWGCILD